MQVIDEYHGPLYYREDPPNPYTFMLFKQEEKDIALTEFWANFFNGMSFNRFEVGNFTKDMKMTGMLKTKDGKGAVKENTLEEEGRFTIRQLHKVKGKYFGEGGKVYNKAIAQGLMTAITSIKRC